MSTDEISFEDLLVGEPQSVEPLSTFRQLLAEGLPLRCGLAGLALIERIEDPDPQFAAVRQGYLQLLKLQRRAA